MRKYIKNWKVSKLLRYRSAIDLAPAYQRGPAWTVEKQSLLIDSIFQNYDLPKVYLATSGSGTNKRFEAIDGQQRLKAILSFVDGDIHVAENSVRAGTSKVKLKYRDLSNVEQQKFLSYALTVSITEGASGLYKRTLFARLQLGERLNPAELRNALQSSAPTELRAIAQTHPFFDSARIPDNRYKREDYLTHVFAFMELLREGTPWTDIKAPALKSFILKRRHGLDQGDLDSADRILDFLQKITQHEPSSLRNKWSFFDAFTHAHRNIKKISKAKNLKSIAAGYKTLEMQRRKYYNSAEVLLRPGCRVRNRDSLYHYILAYKSGGAVKESISARASHLEKTIVL